DRILLRFAPTLSDRATDQLRELGVAVRVGERVERIDDGGVLVGGETIPCRTVLWAAGVRPSPLAAALGAPLGRGGRVVVGPDCAVPRHPEVFVIAAMAARPPAAASRPLPGITPVATHEGRRDARDSPRAQ